jgi:C4-dicarboxylate-specific signal transduction histidine kinase
MFKRLPPSRLWIFWLLSMGFIAAAFYVVLSRGAVESVSDNYLAREETLVKATISNFETFFEAIGKSTAYRARLNNKRQWDSVTVQDMDEFVDEWRDSNLISGILLADRGGVVRLTSNVKGIRDVGESIADRDYFIWAKEQPDVEEYFIGKPVVSRLGASKGQVVVPVASPVFVDGAFKGVLATSIKWEALTQRFLDKVKISDLTYFYFLDTNKDILYTSPGSATPSADLMNLVSVDREGKMQKDGQLIAYSTMELGNQNWILVAVSPSEGAYNLTPPFYIRQTAILVIIALTTLGFGIYMSRETQNKLK